MRTVRRRAVRLSWAAGLAACCALAAGGCSDDGTSGEHRELTDPGEGESAWHDLGGGQLPAFRLALPEDFRVVTGGAPELEGTCEAVAWRVLDGPEEGAETTTRFTLYSLDAGCPVDPQVNEHPLNGRYAAFRSAADVPDGVAADSVDTALGRALAFTQTYTECTNSCRDFDQPSVVITLDAPAAPGHQALVLTSFRGESSEAELTRLAREQLAAADPSADPSAA